MKLKITTLVVITLMIFACKSSKFTTSNNHYTKINLDLKTNNISIIDKRSKISEQEDIRIPVLSLPSDTISFYPKINNIHKELIKKTILENLNNSSTDTARIIIFVLEASKEFSATNLTEQELVSIKLKLVFDAKGEKHEIIESGEFYKKSMDASKKGLEKLFQKALKEIVFKALQKYKSKTVANMK